MINTEKRQCNRSSAFGRRIKTIVIQISYFIIVYFNNVTHFESIMIGVVYPLLNKDYSATKEEFSWIHYMGTMNRIFVRVCVTSAIVLIILHASFYIRAFALTQETQRQISPKELHSFLLATFYDTSTDGTASTPDEHSVFLHAMYDHRQSTSSAIVVCLITSDIIAKIRSFPFDESKLMIVHNGAWR